MSSRAVSAQAVIWPRRSGSMLTDAIPTRAPSRASNSERSSAMRDRRRAPSTLPAPVFVAFMRRFVPPPAGAAERSERAGAGAAERSERAEAGHETEEAEPEQADRRAPEAAAGEPSHGPREREAGERRRQHQGDVTDPAE